VIKFNRIKITLFNRCTYPIIVVMTILQAYVAVHVFSCITVGATARWVKARWSVELAEKKRLNILIYASS